MDILQLVTRYVAPSILGGIAGLFSPWGQYLLQARLNRDSTRRELLTTCESHLLGNQLYYLDNGGVMIPEQSYEMLIKLPAFARLEPYLSDEAKRSLEKYRGFSMHNGHPTANITVIVGTKENMVRKIIASELGRLKKKWRLI